MIILKTERTIFDDIFTEPCCETMKHDIEERDVIIFGSVVQFAATGLTVEFCPYCGEKITLAFD